MKSVGADKRSEEYGSEYGGEELTVRGVGG